MRRAEALLHNMSCRPETETRAWVAPLRSPVVRFELGLLPGHLTRHVWQGTLPEGLLAEAESLWAGLAFTGVALVFRWSEEVTAPPEGFYPPQVLLALDPRVVVNVVGRSRGSLLLPRWPIASEPDYLLRSLASCDPRLAALARRTGWKERP